LYLCSSQVSPLYFLDSQVWWTKLLYLYRFDLNSAFI